MKEEDKKFLYSLIVDWAKEAPMGLCPTMYGTNTQEGDQVIVDRVNKLLEPETPSEPFTAEDHPDVPKQYKAKVDRLINAIMDDAEDLMSIVEELIVEDDRSVDFWSEKVHVLIKSKER